MTFTSPHPPDRLVVRWHRTLATFLATAALLMAGAGTAEAHEVLVGTSPKDGSTTRIVPARVSLTFAQPVLSVGTTVIVTGPAGQVQTGKAALADRTVIQSLRPGSPAGRYTVLWRATSADGHPVSGKYSFTATSPSPAQLTTAPTTAAPTTPTTSAAPTPTPSSAAATSTPATPTSATSTPASAAAGSSGLWWVVAGVVVLLLVLAGFILTRKPRSTPESERDPKS